MNYVIIFNIKNKREEYIDVAKKIESILNCKECTQNFFIVKTVNKNLPANKLEEPLDGTDISSSYSHVEKSDYNYILKTFNRELRFHIRVSFSQNENVVPENLHYLALLVAKFDYLVKEKKISFFLVPRSLDKYPYNNNGYIDTELYRIASEHLRALIGENNKGVIYGVEKQKINDNNIVKALDFSIVSKSKDYFPVLLLDGNIVNNVDAQQMYINSVKTGNALQRNINLESVNNYSLLFNEHVVNQYITVAKQLNGRQRFGLSTHKNPNIALCDYVFETSYNLLKNKVEATEISLENIVLFLKNEFELTNIFTFALFTFILNLIDQNNMSEADIKIRIKSTYFLSSKISSGVEQIIQNSLQHSSDKICVVSFFIAAEKIKIIISDLSNKSIVDTFYKNLTAEEDYLSKCVCNSKDFEILSDNIMYFPKSDLNKTKKTLNLNCFFNDFRETHGESNELTDWFNFRMSDSSAHIGMALFANSVKRCGGDFSLISCNTYNLDLSNKKLFYSTDEAENNSTDFPHLPGTEYNITLPTEIKNTEKTSNIVQLYNTDYIENYNSFAKFLDYQPEIIKYTPDKTNMNATYTKIKNTKIDYAIQKFSLQIMWTNYWLNVFEGIKNKSQRINCINYENLGIRRSFLETSYAKETIIKGLIDAITVFSNKNSDEYFYLAIVNIEPFFLSLFEEISVSLSLKAFPANIQLFISDKDEDSQIQLFGCCYGQAIKNAYSLSLENYYKSYDGAVYYDVDSIMRPFSGILSKDNTQINVCPFSGILKSDFNDKSMFFTKIKKLADKSIINDNGYKLFDNHTRLGNKVHIDSFYEMSHLFHRTMIANHVAFYIIRELIKNNTIDIKKDSILFYGYSSYSQAILMSLTMILEEYRFNTGCCNKNRNVSYSIYQYNLQYEADAQNIKTYLSNPDLLNDHSNINVIQIVPISSTLTTFAKMWNKLNSEYNKTGKLELCDNYTVFLVRDSAALTNSGINAVSELEKKYFDIVDGKVVCKLASLGKVNTVNYITTGNAKWRQPETCEKCFPKTNFLDEKPIIETDPTSTVPAQQIYAQCSVNQKKKQNLLPLPEKSISKYQKLFGNVFYGHYYRGKNHYQYFIDTQSYFAAVSDEVKAWLTELKNKDAQENKRQVNYPSINVIFSPSHNTNVGFSQYVNAYYFNGTAEIISINEDKEYTSNFSCEYAMLKNTIKRLVEDNLNYVNSSVDNMLNYRPVRFIFVDDNIITGDSFRKANKLLQSLIPKNILAYYGTNIFEKCFVLIDRMSQDSRNSFIISKEDYYAFCEINVSNMRKYGDSCVCCKFKKQINSLYNRSSTRFASDYWNKKAESLKEVSFENISKDSITEKEKRIFYLRLMFSHIIREYINDNVNDSEEILKKIILLIDFFCNNKLASSLEKEQYDYLNSYLSVLKYEYNFSDQNIFKREAVESIIKIISRPFFTFNSNVKQGILRFSIILCETIICGSSDSDFNCKYYLDAVEVSKSILELYGKSNTDLLDFLQNTVFDAITDLHSTYLLRIKTIQKVLLFLNSLSFDEYEYTFVAGRLTGFFLYYSVCVQRLITVSSDETRSLRMEYLLISAKDTFCENYNSNSAEKCESSFYERMLDKVNLKDVVQSAFKCFCDEVFLGNTRILYDGIEKINKEGDDFRGSASSDNTVASGVLSSDNYFSERWCKFRTLDYNWLKKSIDTFDLPKQQSVESNFYNLLNEETPKMSNNNFGVIEYRYSKFLECIKKMIIEKYGISDSEIHIALLTCYKLTKDNADTIKLRDLEMIENTFCFKKIYSEKEQTINSYAKYNLKKDLLDTIKQTDFQKLGYRIVESVNTNGVKDEKSYFIIHFQNIKYDNNGNAFNSIIPVFMYLSISSNAEIDNKGILYQLIMRDILTYRNKIINYLEEDFTNDVMQRYAVSVDTEAILKNEKVMSHTPMDQDKDELEYLLAASGEKMYKKYIDKIKGWSIARNYCNTMIARLYNRVFRNINISFRDIIDEYEYINKETYKLYIQAERNDGKSIPLKEIVQVIPKTSMEGDFASEDQDVIFTLFNEIITFDIDIPDGLMAYTFTDNDTKYAYNLDYVKSIIYRICFDAMRFSYGSGAESNDFIARIFNHYKAIERTEYMKSHHGCRWYVDDCPPCYIKFSFEKSNSQNFDWLVIENALFKDFANNLDFIKAKLEDPLDFTDGHMSLVTAKEYFSKMLVEEDSEYLLDMYSYRIENDEEKYFVTKLPIISKRRGFNGSNLDR